LEQSVPKDRPAPPGERRHARCRGVGPLPKGDRRRKLSDLPTAQPKGPGGGGGGLRSVIATAPVAEDFDQACSDRVRAKVNNGRKKPDANRSQRGGETAKSAEGLYRRKGPLGFTQRSLSDGG